MDTHPMPARLQRLFDSWVRAGRPRQKGFSWNRESWRRHLPEHTELFGLLPDLIDRDAVRPQVQQALDRHDAARAFVAVMIWGYGKTGYGPFRTMRVLGKNTGVEEILLEAAERCRRDGGPDAFEWLAPRRPKWLGVAYGSKFLYFCNADTGKPPALVLDRLVKGWLARHAGWQPSLSWFSADYRLYVEKVSCWAEQLSSEGSPVTADDVEYLIFTDAADPGPGCPWPAPGEGGRAMDRVADDAPSPGHGDVIDALDEALEVFTALPPGLDPEDVDDFERGIRQLRRIVTARRERPPA